MDNIAEKTRFQWSNSKGPIVRRIGNGSVPTVLQGAVLIPNNGTVRMNNLMRTDDGEYKLEIYNGDGQRTALWTLQLNIQGTFDWEVWYYIHVTLSPSKTHNRIHIQLSREQIVFCSSQSSRVFLSAPVSSVQLKSECLSQGEQRMSCSCEGDRPQFSWTLDGDTLTDDQLLSGNNETNEITLNQTVSGKLVCTVRNHVSEASGTEMISTCGEWQHGGDVFIHVTLMFVGQSLNSFFPLGYIFIACQLSNGTNITQWVSAANNTLCNHPTTPTPTITSDNVGKKSDITVSNNPSTIFTSFNQTSLSTDQPWYFRKW